MNLDTTKPERIATMGGRSLIAALFI